MTGFADNPTLPGPGSEGWYERVAHAHALAESVGLTLHSCTRWPDEWRLRRNWDDLVTGSLNEVEAYLRHEMLWDPTRIDHEAWGEAGVDPSSLTSDIAGRTRVAGFKRCGGKEFSRGYAINVWSQLYTVDDFRKVRSGTDFDAVTIADRVGYRYRPRFDHGGDQWDLLFAAEDGSCSIEVIRLSRRVRTAPVDRLLQVAQVLVPHLPIR
ncbi:hypothetical protein [Nocardia macrotermitis]|uniref:Uncharacterized protein n=1 Tax=Nocardia macrotermitis TaxID=2585198 RepID=A0A7K0DHS1_9NOCA|nr:hypothetical protein [Nocardia macrotermitis]MQY24344.1 hypothetical protein [Nocardia macrotermitis]